LPDEVSVIAAVSNVTVALKLATGITATGGAVTVMTRVAVLPAPLPLVAVSVTVYVPATAYVTDGFRMVELVPLAKLHA